MHEGIERGIFVEETLEVGTADPVGKDDGMFSAGGDYVLLDGEEARVTLDFVCYSCHADPIGGNGGSQSPLTLQELSDRAVGIHEEPGLAGR